MIYMHTYTNIIYIFVIRAWDHIHLMNLRADGMLGDDWGWTGTAVSVMERGGSRVKESRTYIREDKVCEIRCWTRSDHTPASVFVQASWISGGLFCVEANAWSSAEVTYTWSNNGCPLRSDSKLPADSHVINIWGKQGRRWCCC